MVTIKSRWMPGDRVRFGGLELKILEITMGRLRGCVAYVETVEEAPSAFFIPYTVLEAIDDLARSAENGGGNDR